MSSPAIFWLILTIILAIVEAATPTLVCIWPAIGALTACIFAAFDAPIWLQIAVFVILTVILIILTKPLVKKYVSRKITATNADRIIGAEGVVIQEIDPIENTGQVKVMGQVWSAKAADGKAVQTNARVIVKALEGVKVIVEIK